MYKFRHLCNCYTHFNAANDLSFTSCGDDVHTVYVDGKQVASQPYDGNWNENVISNVPLSAQILAVSVTNLHGVAGLRGALTNGTVITDSSWKCTTTLNDGWQDITFDDSNWPAAVVRDYPMAGCDSFPSAALKALWTEPTFSTLKTIYCRKQLKQS